MVEELLDDTKFVLIPKPLADRLRLVSTRLGCSVSDYASDSLTQALRIYEMGSTLEDAVDLFHLVSMQRGAGNLAITRGNFKELLLRFGDDGKDYLHKIWNESGRWYGAYLKAKLNDDDLFSYLEKDLLVYWNLDEVEITQQDLMVSMRCTSFSMSMELTELLVNFLVGLMKELNFNETGRDVLRGLVIMKFLGKLKN